MTEILFKELSYAIVGAAMQVHKTLGSAFLESVYEAALALELKRRGIAYERQKLLPVFYLGEQVGEFKVDPSKALRLRSGQGSGHASSSKAKSF